MAGLGAPVSVPARRVEAPAETVEGVPARVIDVAATSVNTQDPKDVATLPAMSVTVPSVATYMTPGPSGISGCASKVA